MFLLIVEVMHSIVSLLMTVVQPGMHIHVMQECQDQSVRLINKIIKSGGKMLHKSSMIASRVMERHRTALTIFRQAAWVEMRFYAAKV